MVVCLVNQVSGLRVQDMRSLMLLQKEGIGAHFRRSRGSLNGLCKRGTNPHIVYMGFLVCSPLGTFPHY
jgi:hypothetical protein